MKRCTKCGLEKDESEFWKNKRRKDGLNTSCAKCDIQYQTLIRSHREPELKEYQRRYNVANRERLKAQKAEYRLKNNAEIRTRSKEWHRINSAQISAQRKEAARKDPIVKVKRMLLHARKRSEMRGMAFSIDVNDVMPLPDACPVFATPLSLSGCPGDFSVVSIDRVNPQRGYVPGNVAVISHRANTLKRDATIEELELVLAYMKRHAAQQEQQEQGPEPCNT